MSEPVKRYVYVTTKGVYSNYSIIAIFSSEELAQRFIGSNPDTGYSGWNDIELMELDPHGELIRAGYTFFNIWMLEDGTTTRHTTMVERNDGKNSGWQYWSHGDPNYDGKRWFIWDGWAKDLEHATKCANEYRIMLLTKPEIPNAKP